MTTYKTGNPIGSTAAKDLYDNAENFDTAVNDRSSDYWTDRLGVSRQTWSGIERSGGIQGFETLADLQASPGQSEGQLAQVTNGGEDTGLYRWSGEQWVKTDARYADFSKVQKIYEDLPFLHNDNTLSDGSDLFDFQDSNGKTVLRIDENSGLHLPGIEGSLQEMSGHGVGRNDSDLVNIIDNVDSVILRIDENAGLHLPGIEGSLQENISYLYSMIGTTGSSVNQSVIYDGFGYCPPPFGLVRQDYTISDDSWIDKFSVYDVPETPLITPYDPRNGVVHPYLIEFTGKFRGYKYFLAITPYDNSEDWMENPCVYGSNDLITFDLLDGFEQPLAHKPDGNGHLSDVAFAYDPRSGELICLWRKSMRKPDGNTLESIQYRTTKDGYNWTDERQMFEVYKWDDMILSPALVFDPETEYWHMYTVADRDELGVRRIRHRKSKDLDNWSLFDYDTIPHPESIQAWHLEVRYIGDKLAMLLNDQHSGKLFFGVSDDFVNFTISEESLLKNSAKESYKATFNPVFQGNRWAVDVVWTTNGAKSNVWELAVSRSNFIEL